MKFKKETYRINSNPDISRVIKLPKKPKYYKKRMRQLKREVL